MALLIKIIKLHIIMTQVKNETSITYIKWLWVCLYQIKGILQVDTKINHKSPNKWQ